MAVSLILLRKFIKSIYHTSRVAIQTNQTNCCIFSKTVSYLVPNEVSKNPVSSLDFFLTAKAHIYNCIRTLTATAKASSEVWNIIFVKALVCCKTAISIVSQEIVNQLVIKHKLYSLLVFKHLRQIGKVISLLTRINETDWYFELMCVVEDTFNLDWEIWWMHLFPFERVTQN